MTNADEKKIDDGGSAFPAINFIVPSDLEERHVRRLGETQGMSLRDYFAGRALAGGLCFFQEDGCVRDESEAAKWAYLFADAMLKERVK